MPQLGKSSLFDALMRKIKGATTTDDQKKSKRAKNHDHDQKENKKLNKVTKKTNSDNNKNNVKSNNVKSKNRTTKLTNREVTQPLVQYLYETGQKDLLAKLGQAGRDLHRETKTELLKIKYMEKEVAAVHERLMTSTVSFWDDVVQYKLFRGKTKSQSLRMPQLSLAFPLLTTLYHLSPHTFTHDPAGLSVAYFKDPSDLVHQMMTKVLVRHIEKKERHTKNSKNGNGGRTDMLVWKKLFPQVHNDATFDESFAESVFGTFVSKGGLKNPILSDLMEAKVNSLRKDLKFIKKSISEVRESHRNPSMEQQGCILYIASMIISWQLLALNVHIRQIDPADVYRMVFISNNDPVLSRAYDVIMEMYDLVAKYVLRDANDYANVMKPLQFSTLQSNYGRRELDQMRLSLLEAQEM
jgi:hypothetical protein